MSEKIIQSYVWHKDKLFFVSTINRQSSSYIAETYAETMVWECDLETRERKDGVIWMGDGPRDTLNTHLEACRELRHTGQIKEQ